MQLDNQHSTSLNKFISETGVCSRREADEWIRQGKVCINGNIAVLGNRVFPGDLVTLNGKPISSSNETPVYILLNKPVGIICTTEAKVKDNIIDFVRHPRRIFPVGRLDRASEGLILLTSDGDIVNKILRAGNQHEKEYIVTVNKPLTPHFLQAMRTGVPILGTRTQPCTISQVGRASFRIILTQGLNRQIRRMCTFLGYEVQTLKRIRIMNLTLDNLPLGKWRNLTTQEFDFIQAQIASSSKTEEASRLAKPPTAPKKDKHNTPHSRLKRK